jgi:type IV pilus assembly protein PilW
MRLSSRVAGTILIEVLISALIGIALIGSMFEIYITSQQSFRLQSALNQLQENAKTAANIISTEIHRAGYIGCAKLTDDFPVRAYQHYSITPQNKLSTTNDTITIRYAGLNNVELVSPMKSLSMLLADNSVIFKKNNILIISDCRHAEIFQVKNVSVWNHIQKIVSTMPLHDFYNQHAEISRFEINHIYTAHSALYLENIHHSKIRLVDGVESIQVLSGREIILNVASQSLYKEWYVYVSE